MVVQQVSLAEEPGDGKPVFFCVRIRKIRRLVRRGFEPYVHGGIRLLYCRYCTMVSGDSICRTEYPPGIGSIDCGTMVMGLFCGTIGFVMVSDDKDKSRGEAAHRPDFIWTSTSTSTSTPPPFLFFVSFILFGKH